MRRDGGNVWYCGPEPIGDELTNGEHLFVWVLVTLFFVMLAAMTGFAFGVMA